MKVEELVNRLRSRAYEIYGQTRYSNYLDKAANKLEELAAENKQQFQMLANQARAIKELQAALAKKDVELAEVKQTVALFEYYGCPICHGDCAAANPPVYCCPMEAARRVRERDAQHLKEEKPAVDIPDRILSALKHVESTSAAEPVAWVAADTLNSPHPRCVSSLAYVSQIDKDRGRKYLPLYTHPAPSEVRLREALENIIAIGGFAVGNAAINYMVNIARRALEEQEQKQ